MTYDVFIQFEKVTNNRSGWYDGIQLARVLFFDRNMRPIRPSNIRAPKKNLSGSPNTIVVDTPGEPMWKLMSTARHTIGKWFSGQLGTLAFRFQNTRPFAYRFLGANDSSSNGRVPLTWTVQMASLLNYQGVSVGGKRYGTVYEKSKEDESGNPHFTTNADFRTYPPSGQFIISEQPYGEGNVSDIDRQFKRLFGESTAEDYVDVETAVFQKIDAETKITDEQVESINKLAAKESFLLKQSIADIVEEGISDEEFYKIISIGILGGLSGAALAFIL